MKSILLTLFSVCSVALAALQQSAAGEIRCGNLLRNPGFEDTNAVPCRPTGFYTDLAFVCAPPFSMNGQSGAGNNPQNYNGNFVGVAGARNGKYLFGDPNSGTWRAWYDSVYLIAGLRYEFSFYARNIDQVPGHIGPTLVGRVGGQGGASINRADNIPLNSGWVLTSGIFTAQTTGLTEIAILVSQAGFIGFDYGIDDVSLVMLDPIRTQPSPDTTICFGQKLFVSVTPSIPLPNMVVAWQPPYAVSQPDSARAEFIADTTIQLIARSFIPGVNCLGFDTIQVTVTHEKGAIAATSTTFCEGKPVILSVNGTQAEWSTGDTATAIQARKPGTYSVRYRAPSGCIATASQVVGGKASLGVGYEKRLVAAAGTMVCDTISLVNSAPDTLFLDPQKLHFARNIMFSLPQHQLPAVIPPNDSITATVCFHPTIPGEYSDTLSLELFGYCSRDYILRGQAEEYEYAGKEHCNVVVKGFPLWDDIILYPQPTSAVLNLKISGAAEEYSCSILTAAGVQAMVFSATGGKICEVDLSGLAAGVCYLEIRGNSAIGIIPLTIMK